MKTILYLIVFLVSVVQIPAALADETLLTQEQIKKLFAERTMNVTAVNFQNKRLAKSKKKTFRVFTTELGAAHTADQDSDFNVRGWFADEDDRFCFSTPLTQGKRDQRNTCGQIVWDGKISYYMYETTKLIQRGSKVANKRKKDLLLIFSNVGKGNLLQQ